MKKISILRKCSLQVKNGHKANVVGHELKKNQTKTTFIPTSTGDGDLQCQKGKVFRSLKRKTR